ncbi:hypothetical protein N5F23_20965 [Pseudomonas sichuanensis]|uniref:hypothetical protein n=1 Tax=Pseudomonas sichuanensis TaxID=2213015 RepID=UPI00244A1276|nr:hypothetical protein [Pseudomonas sichuanensis]MDH0730579.1 hypothetical protein [Pseudomonas sichuanensis]MDH1585060.1 hypothetical protein [Pseudomonas sichuanensis]MDH1594054.1 hypothetical protein [Pseudomonas sichuanensis]MDH1600545.1 hypothetical protein [Pseudomonas sichuanensis]
MKELTITELELIAGGHGVPGAIGGAIVGAATYIGFEGVSEGGSFNGFVGTVATGAVTGFIAGPAGVYANAQVAIGMGQVGFYGGMMGGMISRGLDAAGTNYNR